MEIAVLVGPNGETAPIQAPGEVQVYKYSCNTWEVCRSMPFTLQSARGLNGMRGYMRSVIDFLGECRIFVGYSVIGLPFFELEKAGFTTWEMTGFPPDFLDTIVHFENPASDATPVSELNIIMPRPEPQEVSPGCFSISLKEIQNCSGMVTSKQILLPLLANHHFSNLEIICSHVPP